MKMKFYPNQIFHVYNQGNNKRAIFFSDENYQYFEWKMKAYLPPFADLIAYCLMPNHFHWLIYVHKVSIEKRIFRLSVESIEQQWKRLKHGESIIEKKSTWIKKSDDNKLITLNDAIGILQRSYTRAVNNTNGWSGSLFRADCKSKDGGSDQLIKQQLSSEISDHRLYDINDYPSTCAAYIHNNPILAGLVNENTEWAYSSAKEYAGLKKETMCNINLGRMLCLQ